MKKLILGFLVLATSVALGNDFKGYLIAVHGGVEDHIDDVSSIALKKGDKEIRVTDKDVIRAVALASRLDLGKFIGRHEDTEFVGVEISIEDFTEYKRGDRTYARDVKTLWVRTPEVGTVADPTAEMLKNLSEPILKISLDLQHSIMDYELGEFEYEQGWKEDHEEGGFRLVMTSIVRRNELPWSHSSGPFSVQISSTLAWNMDFSYGDADGTAEAQSNLYEQNGKLLALPYSLTVSGGEHASGAWDAYGTCRVTVSSPWSELRTPNDFLED